MWLETNIDIYDATEVELGLEPEFNRVRAYINVSPSSVVAVRECIDNGKTIPNKDESFLYMNSGEAFLIKEKYDNILKILKDEQNSNV